MLFKGIELSEHSEGASVLQVLVFPKVLCAQLKDLQTFNLCRVIAEVRCGSLFQLDVMCVIRVTWVGVKLPGEGCRVHYDPRGPMQRLS